MHGDHHGLWIDPKNPSVLYNVNDGGFYKSADAGKTWRFAVVGGRLAVLQRRASTPARRRGPTDRSRTSAAGAAASICRRDATRFPAVEWTDAPGGEGSHQAIDPQNPNIVYSHGFYGNFTREDVALSRAPAPAGQPAGRGRGARPGVTQIRPPRQPRRPGAARAVDGADHRLAPRCRDHLCRLPVRDPLDRTAATAGRRSART